MNIIKRVRKVQDLLAHVGLLVENLSMAIDRIDELTNENLEIRKRGELLAWAIENNNWDVNSAVRLSDSVSYWREFQRRIESCQCEDCTRDPVFTDDKEITNGLD